MKHLGLSVLFITVLFLNLLADTPLIFNSQEFAPFIYTDQGQPTGPGAEIISLVCKNCNMQYKLNILPWTRAVAEAENGTAQGLFFLAKTPERDGWLIFSDPLIETEYGFFVLKDNKTQFSDDFSEFSGKTIGVYGPSNTATSLKAFTQTVAHVSIDMTPDDESAFKKLSASRFEAVYSNKAVGLALLKKLNIQNVKYAGKHKPLTYYIALTKKTNPEISAKFFKELHTLKNNGTIEKIMKKYGL